MIGGSLVNTKIETFGAISASITDMVSFIYAA